MIENLTDRVAMYMRPHHGATNLATSIKSMMASALAVATSRKTAIILITMFLTAIVAQVLIPQRNSVAQDQLMLWKARYPMLAEIASVLGLHHIASTPWFWVLSIALIASIAASAVYRISRMMRSGSRLHGTKMLIRESMVSPTSPDQIASVLRERGNTLIGLNSNRSSIKTRAGRLGQWGSIIFHGGLVIVFIGVVISSATRFTGFVELAPGQVFAENDGYAAERGGPYAKRDGGLLFGVDDISVTFWPDGSIRGISADIVDGASTGVAEASGLIRRNKTIGISNSQVSIGASFGPSALLEYQPYQAADASYGYVNFERDADTANQFQVPDPSIELVRASIEGDWREALGGSNNVDDLILALRVTGVDGVTTHHQLALTESLQLPNGAIRFVELRPWALFMITRDAGLRLIALGGLIGLVGLAMALFIEPRFVNPARVSNRWVLDGMKRRPAEHLEKESKEIRTAPIGKEAQR